MHTAKITVTKKTEEKLQTRSLYEQAFEDPKSFVNYYYSEKMKDNLAVIYRNQELVISMLHLNPYTVIVNGKEAVVYYIVAVATDLAYRRQGYMAALLQASFREMEKAGIPFCFLLPVDEAIYKGFGFETICSFISRADSRSLLSYEEVMKEYEVYCKRDALYEKRKRMEDALADAGDTELLPKNPVIMARITNREACAMLFKVSSDTDEKTLMKLLKQKRCYFREEV